MKKQLRRHVSQFLVYVLVSNLFIVFDTRAMAVPVVVPVAAETLMTAGVYLAGIVSSVIRNKCYMPEVPGSQIGKAGIDPSQPVRVVTPSVAVDVIKSVVVADKALCVAIGAQVASGTVATPTDGKNTAAVEVAGQLAQVGAHVGVVEKTAGVSIANQEYIKLAQEQLVVRCPGIYSPTPYVPRTFKF